MPSLFSHHTSCFKPTSRWQIITIIKADSWKWMVISPLGSSSSLHFPFSLFLACHCPCYKQCQVLIFCLSRSTSAQYALTDTDRHPPPLSVRQMLQEHGNRLASSAYLWTVTVLNTHVKHQCSEVWIPRDFLTESMPDEWDSNPSLVYSAKSICVRVLKCNRIR